MRFLGFEMHPQEETPNATQDSILNNELAQLEMQGDGSSHENSLSPISQIVGTFRPCYFLRFKTNSPSDFNEIPGEEPKGNQPWHDSIPSSSVSHDEEMPALIPAPGTAGAGSDVVSASNLAGTCKADADINANPLKTLDEESWIEIPTPEPQHGEAKSGDGELRPVSSPLEGQSLEETGADEGIRHQCGNKAGMEQTMAGISRPAILNINDVDEIADHDPKAIMPGVANHEAAISNLEVIQLMPGSWPSHLEGTHDRRTSEAEDQNPENVEGGFSSTIGDLNLLGAFQRLFI